MSGLATSMRAALSDSARAKPDYAGIDPGVNAEKIPLKSPVLAGWTEALTCAFRPDSVRRAQSYTASAFPLVSGSSATASMTSR
jgi:hypothetical protein